MKSSPKQIGPDRLFQGKQNSVVTGPERYNSRRKLNYLKRCPSSGKNWSHHEDRMTCEGSAKVSLGQLEKFDGLSKVAISVIVEGSSKFVLMPRQISLSEVFPF